MEHKNMKNQRYYFAVCLLVFSHLLFLRLISQNSEYLPPDKTLSFNGKFVHFPDDNYLKSFSSNGVYRAEFEIGNTGDEIREILNFTLFRENDMLYQLKTIPGSDILIGNNGMLAVFDMSHHFMQETTIRFYSEQGMKLFEKSFRYGSLFDFSPSGSIFLAGTDEVLNIIHTGTGQITKLEPCSKASFSENEKYLITAKEDLLRVYKELQLTSVVNTGFFYPRGVVISESGGFYSAIDKKTLKTYSLITSQPVFETGLPDHYSFRDILCNNEMILAGVHYKKDGKSSGVLNVYDKTGNLLMEKEISTKYFEDFGKQVGKKIIKNDITQIPWPFFPFDEVHKVWNHYEQHMGYGGSDWSYLHQGLDIEVPVNEPAYAVEEGWVKLVLTIGGGSYWRVAISPVQVPGYSDGWLYAHLVQSSIQVDVGDYVQVHDYLGDIIYWSADWGHIHFVNIRDQGEIWYYDDDEWGINFNPLLALNPNTDLVVPVIEEFSPGSKFGFCANQTNNYLNPENLSGSIDIIVKISDYHADSEWEQPAFKTYYWVHKLPENTLVFPKTLGQILNHKYDFYESNWYSPYAQLIYKMDDAHPSPYWMNFDRDYFQILTNNNGDSVAETSEMQLGFETTNFYDGDYRLFVEAWDESGNMTSDSMNVYFNNGNINHSGENQKPLPEIIISPNPADQYAVIELPIATDRFNLEEISLLNAEMVLIEKFNPVQPALKFKLITGRLAPGSYFLVIRYGNNSILKKLLINHS
jgi:hypothetical protein